MLFPRQLIIAGIVAVFVTVMTVPAMADDDLRVKMTGSIDVTVVECANGHVLDITTDSYWFQTNKSEEQGDNGLRIVTFHQTHTYTSRSTGESFDLINTGVARLYFDEGGAFILGSGSGHTHVGDEGDLIYGWQGYTSGETMGHDFSVCEMFD